jgi:hypothetical protein
MAIAISTLEAIAMREGKRVRMPYPRLQLLKDFMAAFGMKR